MSTISQNIADIRGRIADACARAGRKSTDVRMLAVSKFVAAERIAEAIDCGLTEFGENRAQELREKQTFFEKHGCMVHFIGQLQTNKVRYVCGVVDMVQSLDRIPLAEALSARAVELGCVQDVMIQVNIGGEAQKGGIPVADLEHFMRHVIACDGLHVTGLMCVPPAVEPAAVRQYYAKMRALRGMLNNSFPGKPIRELSMGMSHDFEAAIEEGATIVRIGTGVFGARRANA